MSLVDEPSISVEPVAPGRSLLRHPSFVKLWVGETASAVGTQISAVAIPLTAVVYLRANAFQVGLLTMFETLAFLVIGLPSGPLVDRSRKRPIMLVANLGRMVALGSIPAAAASGVLTMTQLYVAALAVGLLSVPFGIAYQSYLPELVDRRAIVEGSSKMQASSSAAEIVWPSIAGALIGVVTAPWAILVDSASYLVSALMIHSIPAEAQSRPAPAPRRRYGPEIREGLRFVLGQPVLRSIAACGATSGLFEGVDGAAIVLYLSGTLHASPQYIGVIFSLCAAGGLIGALIAERTAQRFGSARTLIASIGLASPFAVLTVIAQPGWSTILVGIGGIPLWMGLVIYNTTQFGYRQQICPSDMRGRMNATMQVINNAFAPVGALLGGALGIWFGTRVTLAIAAVGLSASVLWLLFSPIRKARDLSKWRVSDWLASRESRLGVEAGWRDTDAGCSRAGM